MENWPLIGWRSGTDHWHRKNATWCIWTKRGNTTFDLLSLLWQCLQKKNGTRCRSKQDFCLINFYDYFKSLKVKYTHMLDLMEFLLNVFTEFTDKKYLLLKGLEPATSCIRDQDATTAPARHVWETGSLNWAQFMLQWFIWFSEFTEITEFNESSAPFRKNSNKFRCVNVPNFYPFKWEILCHVVDWNLSALK